MSLFSINLPSIRPSDFLHACERCLKKIEEAHTDPQVQSKSLAVLWIDLGRVDRISALADYADSKKLDHAILRRIIQALHHKDQICLADPNQVWILLPDLPNLAFAELAATKIRAALEAPLMIADRSCQLRPAIGIASSPEHDVNALGLLSAAEAAAKKAVSQQDGYAIAELQSRHHFEILQALQNELRWAITNNNLEVFYQPQIELKTGRCVSAEALIRWQRTPAEWVPADRIVAIAEAHGMIYDLTMFTLHTICRQYTELQAAGYDLQYAINLSPSLLEDSNLASAITDTLNIWNIPPHKLMIEVTESSIINDFELAILRFTELRNMGMQISIDDFGTGYSSLAYLRRFPLNELKIDQIFVRGMLDNPGDARIVKSVINLAHTFDLLVVAEGVENAETATQLQQLGCDITQGYYYSKPLDFNQFKDWLSAYPVK